MAWKRTLLCRFCGEKFSWTAQEWPNECPLCNAYVGLDGKPEVAAPFIPTRTARNADSIYRAMETGAEHRANVAAELLGVPREDANALKITNMGDNARPGEASAPALTSDQQSMLRQARGENREGVVSRFSAAELNHPKSGIGTGIATLGNIRASRYAK
jgi:hypothetical protein